MQRPQGSAQSSGQAWTSWSSKMAWVTRAGTPFQLPPGARRGRRVVQRGERGRRHGGVRTLTISEVSLWPSMLFY